MISTDPESYLMSVYSSHSSQLVDISSKQHCFCYFWKTI